MDSNITATVILDVQPLQGMGHRLTTLEVTMPKFLVAQLNTHRALVKNSASSRAIPVTQFIRNILKSPVTPANHRMPANSSGMIPKSYLKGIKKLLSIGLWNTGMYLNLGIAYLQHKLGLHKSWANRPLEAYYYTKVLITATDWDNFFNLRIHSDAQDAMCDVAYKIKDAIDGHLPFPVSPGYWYLPYVGAMLEPTQADLDISVSCCAQVSYRTLDMSPDKAKRVVSKLLGDTPHWSPFEHIAVLDYKPKGSYKSWSTYRHILNNQ